MVGGTFVSGHKAPGSMPGHLCQWHPTRAKPSCTPISWHSANWYWALETNLARETRLDKAMANISAAALGKNRV